MQPFDLSLPTPAQNLAFDEALLDWAEQHAPNGEYLRLWEFTEPMVVVGRSSRVAQEVNVEFCREHGVPILRRSSGGAAIVTGPGCLMYAVVLSFAVRPHLKDITKAHAFILNKLTMTLAPLFAEAGTITCAGTSDLAIDRGTRRDESGTESHEDQLRPKACDAGIIEQATTRSPSDSSHLAPRTLYKFSGNSLRVKRTHLLYHGTLLYNFDLELIEKCLRTAPRQPEYRKARAHREFVVNLPASRQQLVEAVIRAFPTASPPEDLPFAQVDRLAIDRFGSADWNYEFH